MLVRIVPNQIPKGGSILIVPAGRHVVARALEAESLCFSGWRLTVHGRVPRPSNTCHGNGRREKKTTLELYIRFKTDCRAHNLPSSLSLSKTMWIQYKIICTTGKKEKVCRLPPCRNATASLLLRPLLVAALLGGRCQRGRRLSSRDSTGGNGSSSSYGVGRLGALAGGEASSLGVGPTGLTGSTWLRGRRERGGRGSGRGRGGRVTGHGGSGRRARCGAAGLLGRRGRSHGGGGSGARLDRGDHSR